MATRRRQQVDLQVPGKPRTSNELFFDAMLRHQIGILRNAGATGRKVTSLLDNTERDLRNALRRHLRKEEGTTGTSLPTSPLSRRRLEKLLGEIRTIRGNAHTAAAAVWAADMRALALAEPNFVDIAFKTVIPVFTETTLPAPELLRSIVTTRPFEGKVMRGWARSIRRADLERIEGQVQIGLTQGESIPQISRRIVGTASLRGRNGVTEITRRQAVAISRTAANAITNQAKREYYKANSDAFDKELYVATLDGVTTPICRDLDGDLFPIGKGPIPPLHFNCRSVRVATIDGEVLGTRPSKPVHERRLLRDFAKDRRIDPVPKKRVDLPFGTKGDFDAFSRERTRDLIGTVPAKTTYEVWLGRQPAMFQNDVLGQTKGKLFRQGGLTLDKFVDRATFDERTLVDLARTEAAAFRAAGLDPEDFL